MAVAAIKGFYMKTMEEAYGREPRLMSQSLCMLTNPNEIGGENFCIGPLGGLASQPRGQNVIGSGDVAGQGTVYWTVKVFQFAVKRIEQFDLIHD